jgi:hypothetical protein
VVIKKGSPPANGRSRESDSIEFRAKFKIGFVEHTAIMTNTKAGSVKFCFSRYEGLLIMTNDGELTQELAHPKYEHEKEYEVTTSLTPVKDLSGAGCLAI